MSVNEFCGLIKSVREEKMSRKEFARRHGQWHENTLKSYDKDRLPDIDYLYLLHKETGFSFKELVEARARVVLESVITSPDELDEAIGLLAGDSELSNQNSIVIEDAAMDPYIQPGSKCKIDESDKALTPGYIYCFEFEDSYTTRKVHRTLLGETILRGSTDDVLSFHVNDKDRDKLNILGRVVLASNAL